MDLPPKPADATPPIPTPLLTRLSALFPQAKKTTLREMIESKRVLVNGAIVRSLKQELTAKDVLEVLDAGGMKPTLLAGGLRLIHFDSDIIVVEKPAGQLTATDTAEKRPTVWAILRDYFRKQNSKNQVHLIHRLDRDASGLLVFARTWPAFSALKKQFFEHTITREYDVAVHGIPKQKKGHLENLLLEDQMTGDVRVTENLKLGKLAICDYVVLDSNVSKKLAHLRCTLFTGKKHQIRVQLKAIGHTVCGDPRYGKPDEPPHRLALHASKLAFVHPTSNRKIDFNSLIPPGLAHLFR